MLADSFRFQKPTNAKPETVVRQFTIKPYSDNTMFRKTTTKVYTNFTIIAICIYFLFLVIRLYKKCKPLDIEIVDIKTWESFHLNLLLFSMYTVLPLMIIFIVLFYISERSLESSILEELITILTKR